ncbi:FAD:protein FMN transferase [Devosia sp.]|uniref:FAD:protein FMN transferase n=1 Tax=Devosia sp. TaxID=1871048 RepID=UPI002AFE9F9B|nr:FAD:protein FMN transferase [Devosia sp.]
MPKTSTDPIRHALNGPTMGTRWSALFYADAGLDTMPVQEALQMAVAEVDAAMSTWQPDSDLMRLNRALENTWVAVPAGLAEVLDLGIRIGAASGGAFDIGMGDAVRAWGFGPEAASIGSIRAAMVAARRPIHEVLEIDRVAGLARKHAPFALDLNGIAKGYGVDKLAGTLLGFGITAFLVGIDGEMRASGLRPDGMPWTVAVETPDPERRTPHSIFSLENAAVATSGDYRHYLTVQGQCLSHTMDPATGGPLRSSPASVTVVARTCAEADAWASALMVLGPEAGGKLASSVGLNALFLMRKTGGIRTHAVGALFDNSML